MINKQGCGLDRKGTWKRSKSWCVPLIHFKLPLAST